MIPPPVTSRTISERLSFAEKFGFGLGDTASNFVWGTLNSFMPFFYTDIFGISATAAGTIFLFTRIGDGVIDFFMGAIADRTNTKWGKFRPYLIWMSIPLAVVFILTFTTPSFSMTGKIAYAAVTYSLLMIFYTAINIPYGALSGVMTDNPLDRTSLNSFRMALANAGGFLVNALTLGLTAWFGGLPADFNKAGLTATQHDQAAHGYQMTVVLFAVVAVALFFITFLTTKERIHPPAAQKTNLLDDLSTLVRNRHWLLMTFAGLTALTFIIIRAATSVYYCKYYANLGSGTLDVLGHQMDYISFFLILGNAGFITGAICTRFLVAVIGKKYSYIITFLGMSATAAAYYWIPPGQYTAMFVFQFLHNFCGGLNAALFFALIADTADFAEWKFRVRTTGIIFSAVTCAQKVGLGLGGYIVGKIMDGSGFVPNAVQTAAANHAILLMVSLIPAVGYFLIAIIMNLYGLNENFCHQIREELGQRRQQQSTT